MAANGEFETFRIPVPKVKKLKKENPKVMGTLSTVFRVLSLTEWCQILPIHEYHLALADHSFNQNVKVLCLLVKQRDVLKFFYS